MLSIPGIIHVDTRTLLMKVQKLEKNSLNEYLAKNNIPLKLEVNFKDMNKAFELLMAGSRQQWELETMEHVLRYCVYDSEACRILWLKLNLLL